MKKSNKKGFTIIELVIVIAVIAILAAVMVPTFSSIVEKANKSAAQQEAMAYYKEVYALDLSDGVLDSKEGDKDMNYTASTNEYTVDDVQVFSAAQDTKPNKSVKKYIVYKTSNGKVGAFEFYVYNGYTAKYDGSKWTVDKTLSTDFS